MPKADKHYTAARVPPPFFPPDTTKPASRPVPALPAGSSRRGMLAAAASALVAGAAIATAAHGAPVVASTAVPMDDPVLPLYQRWRTLEDAGQVAEQRWEAWREAHPGPWGPNPDPVGVFLLDETGRLNGAGTDVLEEIMLTPATTPAGALDKLKIAAEVWPLTKPAEEFEFHEAMSRDAVLDAVRLLAGRADT
jgi:hypothetical protein